MRKGGKESFSLVSLVLDDSRCGAKFVATTRGALEREGERERERGIVCLSFFLLSSVASIVYYCKGRALRLYLIKVHQLQPQNVCMPLHGKRNLGKRQSSSNARNRQRIESESDEATIMDKTRIATLFLRLGKRSHAWMVAQILQRVSYYIVPLLQ